MIHICDLINELTYICHSWHNHKFNRVKKLLTLMLLLICFSGISQPPGGDRRVILIKNNRNATFLRITGKTWVSVRTNSGISLTGQVKRVHGDTIFLPDTLLRVSDIDSLSLHGGHSDFNMFPDHGTRIVFVAGSPDYQIICPPDSVYNKIGSFHNYYSRLAHKATNKRNEATSPFLYRNFLKMNISKLFHLEIAFSYERMISRKFTWETELSAIFGITSADAYYMINYPIYNYSGFSVTTNPKFYIINSRTYLAPVFMYRYLWAIGMRTDWPGKGGNGELQDQYRNDFGLSIRIGAMKRYGKFVVDFYVGGGVKYIMLHQLVYGSYLYHDSGTMHWYNEDHSPNVTDQRLIGPVINAGIKIGLAF
jgi:hypothetical protein